MFPNNLRNGKKENFTWNIITVATRRRAIKGARSLWQGPTGLVCCATGFRHTPWCCQARHGLSHPLPPAPAAGGHQGGAGAPAGPRWPGLAAGGQGGREPMAYTTPQGITPPTTASPIQTRPYQANAPSSATSLVRTLFHTLSPPAGGPGDSPGPSCLSPSTPTFLSTSKYVANQSRAQTKQPKNTSS